MKQKSISFCQGKGSLTHNNREFIAENVDIERMKNNITFVQQPIAEAYEMLFAESTARYNARQKRSDRKIKTIYYESLFGCKSCNTVRTANDKRKSFYEDVVQIGTKDDSGFNTDDVELVADCLKEYMAGFQERNPNFHVFNAVLHMDEATPHLHIDYIPVGHYKRGQDTQNGIAQALKEMGYGEGKQAIARWRASEVEVLGQICEEHGITPTEPQKSRGTLTIPEYKEQIHKADELAQQNEQAQAKLSETQEILAVAEKKKVKLSAIDDIEVKGSLFKKNITLSKEDYENLANLAKKYVTSVRDNKKLTAQNAELLEKIANLEGLIAEKNKTLEKYTHPTISRSFIKAEQQRISEVDRLKRSLAKAMAVIDSYGLSDVYENYRVNGTVRNINLE